MADDQKEFLVIVDSCLEKLIPQFLKYQRADLDKCKVAFKTHDYKELKDIGHRMKGGCGGYGFHQLGEMGAMLEQAATQGDLEKTSRCIQTMEEYLASLKIQFKQKNKE